MSENNKIFISMDQVTKNYRNPVSNLLFPALRGIDLKIKKGSLSTIIGPSGSGKSTLLNILSGKIKPSTGSVYIDGVAQNLLSPDELAQFQKQTVGTLTQFPKRNLLPRLSAYKNIVYNMEIAGYPLEKRKVRALELLESVGLKNRMQHKLHQLSGGEAQRASLAVALANEPLLLLADEPTGELDTETTFEILDYLKEINSTQKTTMIVVTHDTRFEKLTGRAYRILDGVIAGVRRSRTSKEVMSETSKSDRMQQLESIKQDEISVINQFGMIKIPENLRKKYGFGDYARFVENKEIGKLVLEPVDEEEEQ